MKITRIEAWPVTMPMAESYTITYGTLHSATNVFLAVETDNGPVGFGCAGPDASLTGETAEGVLHTVKKVIEPALVGSDPIRIGLLLHRLRPHLDKRPSSAALVDMALYDIFGKKTGLPVYRLLGGFRSAIKTSVTIGILPLEETVASALDHVKNGFTILKLKGGADVENDIERLARVRQAVGGRIVLRFDANQGYTVEETRLFLKKTEKLHLACLEQPVADAQIFRIEARKNRQTTPLMADESLRAISDVRPLAVSGGVEMINLKLMKVGGIYEGLQIAAAARAANMAVMCGCMDESALAIAAGLHMTLATPNISMADLDGHLGLEGDPAAGAVVLKRGTLYPLPGPGFGLEKLG